MAYDDLMSAYGGFQGSGGYGGQQGGYGGNNGYGSMIPSGMNQGYGMGGMSGMGGMGGQQQNQMPQGQNNGGSASSLMSAIPSILQGFGMIGNQQGNSNINALGGNSANISNAMNNTNNPLYQQLYGQQKEQNMNNLANAQSMLQGQNRMQSAMGRVPLFAQGRGGEEMFRNMMNGYQNNDATAQQQVHNTLAQNLQGSNQALMAAQAQNNANQAQNRGSLASYNSIGQLLKSFM